ncbi:hypothetical protein V1512DRAFT_260306 [Lipomyces arxii]|uniref:uncharacterized protein n=1 Tax=Lipomyces arxii TaxID=56418 RepID=UPI0034CD0DD9
MVILPGLSIYSTSFSVALKYDINPWCSVSIRQSSKRISASYYAAVFLASTGSLTISYVYSKPAYIRNHLIFYFLSITAFSLLVFSVSVCFYHYDWFILSCFNTDKSAVRHELPMRSHNVVNSP